jgi:hypothetical protein
MPALELLVPGLVTASPDASRRLATAAPHLDRLGCRARRVRFGHSDWHGVLFRRFGLVSDGGDWPVAPFTMLADGGTPGPRFCLRADPVHLVADRGALLLADRARLALAQPEADALIASLAAHFGSEGLEFWYTHPRRWYVFPREPARMTCTPPSRATGRSIDPFLPRGPDASEWLRRLNEAQMLLHEHPVNAEREARGAPTANSVWFWGGGRLSRPASSFSGLWSQASLARGLALASGAEPAAVPENAERWLAAARAGTHLVVLDAPTGAPGEPVWEEALRSLETNWFAPLYAALRAGRLNFLRFATSDRDRVLELELARSDLWRVWRRVSALAASEPAAEHAGA